MANKMLRSSIFYALLAGAIALSGCGKHGKGTVANIEELRGYAADPSHGLVQERRFSELVWRVNLLLRELELDPTAESGNQFSLVSNQDNQEESKVNGAGTLHFLLNISPGEAYGGGDVMMNGAANYDEYAERMIQLNFRMDDNVVLEIGGQTIKPKLCHMENTFGLTQDRMLHVIFADPLLAADLRQLPTMELVVSDWVFDTGIHHYLFKEEHLQDIPTLSL